MITTTTQLDAANRQIELPDGARAVAVRDERTGHASLQVYSAGQQLLFEYDEQTGTTRLHVPTGDLEFVVPSGNIRFAASHGIRFAGGRNVRMDAGESSVNINPFKTQITSPQVEVMAQCLDTCSHETNITSQQITARASRIRLLAQTLEIVADTILKTARNIFHQVTELWQVRARRLKASSDSSTHLTGETVTIKSHHDVKIKGEQIHLG